MAHRSSFAAAAGCVVLFALPVGPAIVADSAAAHLDRAVQLLLAPAPTSQDLREGFLSLLDALIATAPGAPSAAACQPKLANARQAASRGSILDDQAVTLLRGCYSDTHGGATFRVPDSIGSVADAVGHCRAQLQSAKDSLQKGRGEDAFGRMIEVAVFIVTPIERHSGKAEVWLWQIGRQWWAAVRVFFVEGFGWLSTVRSSSSG
jgi:hypothetical protein